MLQRWGRNAPKAGRTLRPDRSIRVERNQTRKRDSCEGTRRPQIRPERAALSPTSPWRFAESVESLARHAPGQSAPDKP